MEDRKSNTRALLMELGEFGVRGELELSAFTLDYTGKIVVDPAELLALLIRMGDDHE